MVNKDIKKEFMRKRKTLMFNQEQLVTRHCDHCTARTKNNSNGECNSCKVFVQLQQIGDELNNLSNEKRALIEQSEKGELLSMSLTVERYKDLKAKGKSDREIMKEFGYHSNGFNEWKRENGLINTKQQVKATVTPSKGTLYKGEKVVPNDEFDKLKNDNITLLESLEAARSDLQQYKQAVSEIEIKNTDLQEELQRVLYEKDSLIAELEEAKKGTFYWQEKYTESKKENERVGRLKQLNVLLMEDWLEINS